MWELALTAWISIAGGGWAIVETARIRGYLLARNGVSHPQSATSVGRRPLPPRRRDVRPAASATARTGA